MKVGIPNSFCYIGMEKFLANFLSEISDESEVIFSGPTTNEMVEFGVQNSIEEICMPAKVFMGHIEYLVKYKKVDAILLPRLTSLRYRTYSCPKIIGIPDLVKTHYAHMRIISPELNLRNGTSYVNDFLVEFGKHFTNDKRRLKKIVEGFANSKFFEYLPPIAKDKKNILVLGHSYVIFDNNLNKGILQIIKDSGYNPIYPLYHHISDKEITVELQKPFFWSTAQNIYEYFYWTQKNLKLDGIVYLMTFGCGIDSILEELIRRRCKILNLPYLCITLDEHSANLGIQTRIEAFIDMIGWREENENYISAHG
ncbi:hypothetical protein Csac_2014 [Caldicellulosiruptor saccharolyticus DSM 8903]|uniref:DUF2229 domain-containing protein n=1 Tax=Caldicellulosiruptor saccharolyticus (strain ATCC 43494 / DSM 8903 / Tp8T 6331) TaxID=351627 RepID=A4XL14_CALS8|nr:acyl-CoA dehydratase activase-related protein [Caldicellulosiruptor saccharolyticus]ABP67599.1 hypothetical protein Csac_2014 [Caldicellulosiruptor saccharolyticus DSM 8903]